MVRTIMILALALVFAVAGSPSWLADDGASLPVRMLTYHFFHANIAHLAVNCIAIWSMFRPGRTDTARCLLLGLLISVLVYPLHLRPIIGISNMLFAVSGMRTPALDSAWWKSTNARSFICIMLFMLPFPQFSAVTHIASFVLGVLCACAFRQYYKLMDYAGRYLR